MTDEERAAFAEKMFRMARVLDRRMDAETVDAYFGDLKHLPLDAVEIAIDMIMIRKTDGEDLFETRALPTVPEIRREARQFLARDGAKAGCEKCGMTGWLIRKKEKGQPEAVPCECLEKVRRIKYEIDKKEKR